MLDTQNVQRSIRETKRLTRAYRTPNRAIVLNNACKVKLWFHVLLLRAILVQ